MRNKGLNMETVWADVDTYFERTFIGEDEALAFALQNSKENGLPSISVSPCQGRLLQILAAGTGARRILEVGTLGGYSTICLARGVGEGGRIVTIEVNPEHARVAGENLRNAGLDQVVTIKVGDARDKLQELVDGGTEPFDLVFLDADKQGNPVYLQYVLQLARPGTLIIGDNVVRHGGVVDPASDDAGIVGTRKFCEDQGADPRLVATGIQTVGAKGYDGFTIAVVRGEA